MHIPWLPEQAARLPASPAGSAPSMALPTMVEGVRLALDIALRTDGDLRVSAGAIN